MRICFVVNDVASEEPQYTTVRLALAATRRGHEVWLTGVGDFSHRPDGTVGAHARGAAGRRHSSLESYLGKVQGDDARVEQVEVGELDVVMMRNDPAEDQADRAWAVTSGVLFGQLAVSDGPLVVNDPSSLANAVNKTYFQQFPEVVRPRTLVSRDLGELCAFIADMGGSAVLKPLQGSGGSGVFIVSDGDSPNINQMIEAIARDGYVVAQEVLPAALEGDVRMFVMNGEPLQRDGRYAAFARVNEGPDLRSNMKVGGRAQAVEVTDEMLATVDVVRPKLLRDGMFLVGLDITGDKLMEVNVFSPGGLGSCQQLYDTDFAESVIDSLEHKVALRVHCADVLDNARLATI